MRTELSAVQKLTPLSHLPPSEPAGGVVQPAAALVAQQHALSTAHAVQHARCMRTCETITRQDFSANAFKCEMIDQRCYLFCCNTANDSKCSITQEQWMSMDTNGI
jgi:hypothetical protein